MVAEEFRAACKLLWGGNGGGNWGAERAADHLHVNMRNVRYWAAGRKEIPEGIALAIGREMHRRLLDPADRTPGLAALREFHQRLEQGTTAA